MYQIDFLEKITDVYINDLPDDLIPYWDFNAPYIPDEPRDASAAAIVASALLELSTIEQNDKTLLYRDYAVKMLESLSSEKYRSGNQNSSFLLHSTGHWPNNSEVDASIVYADYYYIEALNRLLEIENL